MSSWKERNPDRSRQLNRESARRVAARKKADVERRRRAVENARKWNEAHPEQRRAQLQRWRDANRDKVRAQARASYARNRDAVAERSKAARDSDPDKYKARARAWREKHPGYSTEYGRRWRENPDNYARQLQQNRDRKRLDRRLKQLDLPPRRLHRTTAAERRANLRDAETFFTSEDRRAWFVQYQVFHDTLDETMTTRGASLHALASARARVQHAQGMPPVDVDEDAYARGVGIVLEQGRSFDLLSSRDVARAVQSVRETHTQRAHDHQREGLRVALTGYVRENTQQLTADAELENRARLHAGKPPLPVDVAAHQIAFDRIERSVDVSALTGAEIDKTMTTVRESHPTLFEPAQPSATDRVNGLVQRVDKLGAEIRRDGRKLAEKAARNAADAHTPSSADVIDAPTVRREGPRLR